MGLPQPFYRLLSEEKLLQRLLEEDQETRGAWKEFLRRYSKLFLKIIWQFETDRDEVMDRYLYVCSKLAADDLAILRTFEREYGDDPPQFASWLGTVVRNLCVDAYRAAHGRKRYPRALLELSDLDRKVFELYYWEGWALKEIEQHVANAFDVTEDDVLASLERIKSVLSASSGIPSRANRSPSFLPYDESNPEIAGAVQKRHDPDLTQWAEHWLDTLPSQERLVVRLRFWRGMTGREIADALQISPTYRVYYILKKALRKLRERALEEGHMRTDSK